MSPYDAAAAPRHVVLLLYTRAMRLCYGVARTRFSDERNMPEEIASLKILCPSSAHRAARSMILLREICARDDATAWRAQDAACSHLSVYRGMRQRGSEMSAAAQREAGVRRGGARALCGLPRALRLFQRRRACAAPYYAVTWPDQQVFTSSAWPVLQAVQAESPFRLW